MPHEVRWSRYAEDDLLNLITYIARDNPAAAQNLKNQLEAKCERLQRISPSSRLRQVKVIMFDLNNLATACLNVATAAASCKGVHG